jgi:hypothetical protein
MQGLGVVVVSPPPNVEVPRCQGHSDSTPERHKLWIRPYYFSGTATYPHWSDSKWALDLLGVRSEKLENYEHNYRHLFQVTASYLFLLSLFQVKWYLMGPFSFLRANPNALCRIPATWEQFQIHPISS